jgi:hypothetical protein
MDRYRVRRVHFEMLRLAHFSYTGIPLLWPVCTEYTLGPLLGGATSPPTNLWAVRREWLRSARSDTNPTHLPPSVVAHRATTLTTFVVIYFRKIHLHPATVMAALRVIVSLVSCTIDPCFFSAPPCRGNAVMRWARLSEPARGFSVLATDRVHRTVSMPL